LRRGGLINESPNFESTVETTLRRAQERDGGVVQTKDKSWGLAEWYPKGAKLPKASQREDMTDDEMDGQVDLSRVPIQMPAAASGNGQPS